MSELLSHDLPAELDATPRTYHETKMNVTFGHRKYKVRIRLCTNVTLIKKVNLFKVDDSDSINRDEQLVVRCSQLFHLGLS